MHAVNITGNSVSICLRQKQSGNEKYKKEYFQINPYKKSSTNKIADEKLIGLKKNAIE